MKILIVDDNSAIRRLIKSIVQPYSSEVSECADGADALRVYCAERPDLVLMDIRMTEMDGIRATKQIKEADPAAKVLIVTDYDDEKLRDEAMRAGAAGYISKENLLDLQLWLTKS